MSTWNHYYLAHSIEDAFGALCSDPGPNRLVAGGTDYLLELQQGNHPPVNNLVDITGIPELTVLEVRGDRLFVGAAVPVSQVADSHLAREHAQAVAEACWLIGGPQVRNTATLGGNVAHALPAADGMIALTALDTQVEIARFDPPAITFRREPILSLFAGPGKSTLLPDREILTGFYLPLWIEGSASAFSRVMRPQGVALPILNLAIWLLREADRIKDIRIAVGPAGPTPRRACVVEDRLRGSVYSESLLSEAGEMCRDSLHFRSSARRASADYRYHLCGDLFEEVIRTAWERSAEHQPDGLSVEAE